MRHEALASCEYEVEVTIEIIIIEVVYEENLREISAIFVRGGSLLTCAPFTIDTYHLAKCERSNGTEV